MPIKSILMVTHNIEEAVLMCDRILVLSSGPGRIATEIKVGLKHPRNRLDPDFRQLVDTIYSRMTQRTGASEKSREGSFPGLGFGMSCHEFQPTPLPAFWKHLPLRPTRARPICLISLLLYRWKSTSSFRIAETLQLLRFVEIAAGDIHLTPAGKKFAGADVDTRKKMFGQHLLTYVPLAARIRHVLDERASTKPPHNVSCRSLRTTWATRRRRRRCVP